jgi:hypothetical protein
LSVVLQGGQQLQFQQNHALGDPEWPMSDEAVQAKALGLLEAAGLAAPQAQALVAQTLALPGSADLGPWWAQLQACSVSSD